jgi:hypothetical protein
MKAKFIILASALAICTLIHPKCVMGFWPPVDVPAILHFEQDSISDTSMQTIIIKAIGKWEYYDCPIHDYWPLYLEKSYTSSVFPNIKLFTFSSDEIRVSDRPLNIYRHIIFNKGDSSIYHYGGDTFEYSQVMRNYLRSYRDSTDIMQIILFYLNTIAPDNYYHIINSAMDVNKLYNRYRPSDDFNDSLPYSQDTEFENIKALEQVVVPTKIITECDGTRVSLFTWEYRDGNIEKWDFIVNSEYIQIVFHKKLLTGIGPYSPIR